MDTGGDREPSPRPVPPYTHLRERLSPLIDGIRSRFEVDTRALAAVRIALGLILVADLVHRAPDLALHYTDAGVYPREVYRATSYAGLSLHAISGQLWVQAVLFVLAGLLALAFTVGYRTRTVQIACVVLLFSLHARNPAVLNGGDKLLRVLLLVSLATPLGERWSIDALRRGSARASVTSVGTAALLVQPVAVFTANVIEKHEGETWFAGDALEIAMGNDVMTVYLGDVVANHPGLLTVLTYAWVTLLAGSTLFLLVPTGRLRALVALAYIGAFAGMLATMAVGWFPFVLATAVTPFLTTPFWDALGRRLPAASIRRRLQALGPGPAATPPLGRRLLDGLEDRGHDGAAARLTSLGRASSTIFGTALLVWILLFSAAGATAFAVPDALDHRHLDQQDWDLYAPDPSRTYGWYVEAAELASGDTVDALTGGPVDFEPPPDANKAYDTFRDRKLMESVWSSSRGEPGIVATSYADWVCRQAQALDLGPVEQVIVYRIHHRIPLGDEVPEDPSRVTAIEHACTSP